MSRKEELLSRLKEKLQADFLAEDFSTEDRCLFIDLKKSL